MDLKKMRGSEAKDIKNNPNMATTFNILLNSPTLTNKEKMDWLKLKISQLPTPFLLLMALFEEDLDTAQDIYIFAGARLLIDADTCQDISAQEGIPLLKQIILPKLFERFGIDLNNTDPQKNSLILDKMEKHFFKNGGFKKFDQEYATTFAFPYWLAYHGVKVFIDKNLNDATLFKPKEQYEDIKGKVFKEMEGYASQRGNL